MSIEQRPLASLGDIAADWDDLATRALERNVFAERAFALTAARHLAGEQHAIAVLVWERCATGKARLVGLFPMTGRHLADIPGLARGWCTPLSGLGVPLVDAERAEAAIAALLDHVAAQGGMSRGVLFPRVPLDGPVAAALQRVAAASGRMSRTFDSHSRAILHGGQDAETLLQANLTPKKLKELRRQLRRLGETGEVRFERLSEPNEVRDGTGIFLALEASGWKGEQGTALAQDPGSAAFVRTMTHLMAEEDRCRVDLLTVGGTPAAAGIVLESDSRAWFWKVAYDERFARFSPGVQLTLDITRRQLERGTVMVTDSCAIAEHPMIDHLWRERMSYGDLFVAARPGCRLASAITDFEALRRRLRAGAKHAYHRCKGGNRS